MIMIGLMQLLCIQALPLILISQGGPVTIALKAGELPIFGNQLNLICTITGKTTGKVDIFITETENFLNRVPANNCFLNEWCTFRVKDDINCEFSVNGNVINIRINSLKDLHRQHWSCVHEQDEGQLFLEVYHVPSTLLLNGPSSTCDLASSNCTFICSTSSCTSPNPTFSWFYREDDDDISINFFDDVQDWKWNNNNGCTKNQYIYGQTLNLPKYKTVQNNAQKSVKLSCKLTFSLFPAISRESTHSQGDVIFAVKTTMARVMEGNTPLLNQTVLYVRQGEQNTLQCTHDNGHPTPIIKWYIDKIIPATGTHLTFHPNNSMHNKYIYCSADNIPDDNTDVFSAKIRLYVEVRIEFVYIEPQSERFITLIENVTEPIECTTSPGRPKSTIRWLRQKPYQTFPLIEGDWLYSFELPDKNYLEVTKSIKNFTISRKDKDLQLKCSAANIENNRVESDIWKEFNILYPPEKMKIVYNGSNVADSRIDVTRGTTISVSCFAESNPPVSNYSWNYLQTPGIKLNILNIKTHLTVICTAQNIMVSSTGTKRFGKTSVQTDINVLYGAIITKFVGIVDDGDDTTNTVTLNENETVALNCNVDSNPASTISLFRGSKYITHIKKSLGLVYTINSTSCSDNGEYICEASNQIFDGSAPAKKAFQLNILCSPVYASGDKIVAAALNTAAVLSLTVFAYPFPTYYEWTKNTLDSLEKIQDSELIQATNDSNQFNLSFQSVRTSDYGRYSIVVENNIGKFSYLFHLKAAEEQENDNTEAGNTTEGLAGTIGGSVGGCIIATIIIIAGVLVFRRKKKTEENQANELIQVDKIKGMNTRAIVQDKANTRKVPVTTRKEDETCYENPEMLQENSKKKLFVKSKQGHAKVSKQPVMNQSHDGLMYVALSFGAQAQKSKEHKKQKPVKLGTTEAVVYDDIQFGVVGEACPSSEGEDNGKK